MAFPNVWMLSTKSSVNSLTAPLTHRPEMPYRVVLNESINLAKDFGADGSHRYINGILDKVAQEKRAVEIKSKAQGERQKPQD
jgi:NusB family